MQELMFGVGHCMAAPRPEGEARLGRRGAARAPPLRPGRGPRRGRPRADHVPGGLRLRLRRRLRAAVPLAAAAAAALPAVRVRGVRGLQPRSGGRAGVWAGAARAGVQQVHRVGAAVIGAGGLRRLGESKREEIKDFMLTINHAVGANCEVWCVLC